MISDVTPAFLPVFWCWREFELSAMGGFGAA